MSVENPCKNCITLSICINKMQETFNLEKEDILEYAEEDVLPKNNEIEENRSIIRHCLTDLTDDCSILDEFLYYIIIEDGSYRYFIFKDKMNEMIDFYFDYMEK